MGGGTLAEDRSGIVFFDVETTIPIRDGQEYAILEFGSIVVSPKKLVELQNYSTLVKPADLNLITPRSVQCNGIKRDDVASAPTFEDIADDVYDILHGRIWAGHIILNFDCPRIREAFAEIGRNPPEPKGTIDSLALLTQRFGRRAGNMKLATLGAYFGLGNQTHRSLDDVRMNIEVLKYCATVLFLESSLPDELIENSVTTPETCSRRRSNIKTSPLQSLADQKTGENITTKPILSFVSPAEAQANPFDMSTLRNEIAPEVIQSDIPAPAEAQVNPFDMSTLRNEIAPEVIQSDIPAEEEHNHQSETVASEGTGDQEGFLDLDKISIPSIRATHVPLYDGSQGMKLQLCLGDRPLRLHCPRLKVQFGCKGKFLDDVGRRKLIFVVYLYPNLCDILRKCDSDARSASIDSGSSSKWNSAIIQKEECLNRPTARIHIPTGSYGDAVEIRQREFSEVTTTQKLISRNPEDLESLVNSGTVLDAFLSLEPYDYMQRAGIRLVGRKLVIHTTVKKEAEAEGFSRLLRSTRNCSRYHETEVDTLTINSGISIPYDASSSYDEVM